MPPPSPASPPPPALIMDLATGAWKMRALAVAAELKIPDLLKNGPITADELAKRISSGGANPDGLYRLLRYLASVGIFREEPGRRFSNTDAGELLRADHPASMRALAIMLSRPWELSTWSALEYSVRTGKTAFDQVYGSDIWTWFKNNPVEADIFNQCMTSFASQVHAAAVEAYDFSGFRKVADIGGGLGRMIGLVLKKHPGLRGVLFDQPHVVADARAQLESMGGDISARCEIVGGSFFESMGAAAGCDAYMMGHILHDWDDQRCIKILQTIRAGSPAGAKLLVVESVITGPNQPDPAKLLDLEMLVNPGGRERTADEYAALFMLGGWRFTRTIPTRGEKSIVEGEAV